MTGPHDMGGRNYNMPISLEKDEPIFHAPWEKNAMALTVAMGFSGFWSIDTSRHARERIGWDNYHEFSYYKIWITALEKLLTENGAALESEIETGEMSKAGLVPANLVEAQQVAGILRRGGAVDRKATRPMKFKIGQCVTTKISKVNDHTRLPEYCMGKSGVIHAVHGFHVFPDSNSLSKIEDPQWLYGVTFQASELFGSRDNHSINLDLWEPYFE